MSAYIKADLDANIAEVQFLCNIPTIDLTPRLEQDNCFISKDSYQNNGWESGRTVHRPVALSCGHILGFQDIIRWMLSPSPSSVRALSRDSDLVMALQEEILKGLCKEVKEPVDENADGETPDGEIPEEEVLNEELVDRFLEAIVKMPED